MKSYTRYLLFPCLLFALNSCAEETGLTPEEIIENNPFKERISFNGLMIDTARFETPNAFLVFNGINDTMSSDYDGYLTDGVFDKYLNEIKVKDYTTMVYFDFNSPSLTMLAPGKYTYVATNARRPGIFNAASHIRVFVNKSIYKYAISEGTVNVEEKNGYILLEYELICNEVLEVKGQYTGTIDFRNPY